MDASLYLYDFFLDVYINGVVVEIVNTTDKLKAKNVFFNYFYISTKSVFFLCLCIPVAIFKPNWHD